jgi:hypothetical protein
MEGAESVGMPAGNVEGEIDRRLDRHIFVGSKAVWYDITDDATQFEAYPAGIDAPGADNPERLPATAGSIGGSCLCGAVAFEFDETLGRMGFCHCSRCLHPDMENRSPVPGTYPPIPSALSSTTVIRQVNSWS